tara:strand:- start:15 stop:239 length:225 start_codon:yes stop_codon:yes gene_type:complete
MKLEYGITSTVAHDPIGKKIKKRKVSSKTGSTQKVSQKLKRIKGATANKRERAGMMKSVRQKQAKKAYQAEHEG